MGLLMVSQCWMLDFPKINWSLGPGKLERGKPEIDEAFNT